MSTGNGSGQHRGGPAGGTPTLSASSGGMGAPVPPAPRLPRARRRPALFAVGAALMALGGLGAVWVVNAASDRAAVLVVARDVRFGAVLSEADLATADVSAEPSVATVAAADRDRMVGRVAGFDLPRGSLLSADSVVEAGPPGRDEVLVAVAVPPNRLPAGSLHPGDRVLVVDTPPVDADVPNQPPGTIPATVVRLGAPDVNGVVVVDVTVAPGDGPALAARSATGRIALVIQPRSR
jgi:SAF domain